MVTVSVSYYFDTNSKADEPGITPCDPSSLGEILGMGVGIKHVFTISVSYYFDTNSKPDEPGITLAIFLL